MQPDVPLQEVGTDGLELSLWNVVRTAQEDEDCERPGGGNPKTGDSKG